MRPVTREKGALLLILRNKHGFALLEILVAGLVLSVGFFGLVSVATSVMQANAFSGRVTKATILAQQKVEEIRRLGYAGLPDADGTITEDYHTIDGSPIFKRTVSIKASLAIDGLKMVTVTVWWDAGKHRVVLKTLIGA